jgi:hypothetical protein
LEPNDPEKAMDLFKKAIDYYNVALEFEPKDDDTGSNKRFVEQHLNELKQEYARRLEAAKRAQESAEQNVKLRKYPPGWNIMAEQMARDKEATEKVSGGYAGRLKDINDIETSKQR